MKFKNLKGLTEERADLVVEMDNIVGNAKKEKRDISAIEKTRFNQIETEIRAVDNEIRAIEVSRGNNDYRDNSILRATKDAVLPGENLVEVRAYDNKQYDFGNLVKFMAGKGQLISGSEQTEYRAMTSGGNTVVIPQKLADGIVDAARAQSAVFGQIPIIQMENNNVVVASVKQDATASFVPEGELIPTSEVIFEGTSLEGKTLALFVPVQEQLLDSANNLTSILMNTCAAAIANTLDNKLIYGTGVDEVKGISLYDTINLVPSNELGYDAIISGIKAVKANNIQPTTIVYNTDLGADLAMLKDTTNQYITPPRVLDKYITRESNNINENQVLCYDMNSLLLGIHKNITIEWGTSADMFQRIQKGLRIYLRTDLALIRPKGISLTTIAEA